MFMRPAADVAYRAGETQALAGTAVLGGAPRAGGEACRGRRAPHVIVERVPGHALGAAVGPAGPTQLAARGPGILVSLGRSGRTAPVVVTYELPDSADPHLQQPRAASCDRASGRGEAHVAHRLTKTIMQ